MLLFSDSRDSNMLSNSFGLFYDGSYAFEADISSCCLKISGESINFWF